jgi:hypothetical protein
VCKRGSNLKSITDLSAIPAQMGCVFVLVIVTLRILDDALCHNAEAWLFEFCSFYLTLLFFFDASEPFDVDAEYFHRLIS